jgi:hypothetical protein
MLGSLTCLLYAAHDRQRPQGAIGIPKTEETQKHSSQEMLSIDIMLSSLPNHIKDLLYFLRSQEIQCSGNFFAQKVSISEFAGECGLDAV